jgi:hypothetical protein
MGSFLHSVSSSWIHTIGLEWDGVALDQDQKSIFLGMISIHLDSRLDAVAYSNKLIITWLAVTYLLCWYRIFV